jgi:hypothetical protein
MPGRSERRELMDVQVRITCGCNTPEKPVVFTTLEAAQKHSAETGHTLHGQVKISR